MLVEALTFEELETSVESTTLTELVTLKLAERPETRRAKATSFKGAI